MTRARTFFGGSLREWVVAWAVIAALIGFGALASRFPTTRSPRFSCTSNLTQLADCYRLAVQKTRFDATLHGSAQILSWLGDDGLKVGQEGVFICPGDPNVAAPENDDERRAFHPADATALRAARGLGSYAVRDFERFPVDPASRHKEPILCDRQGDDGRTEHHRNVIVIAFAEGDVQKMTREELGLGPDDPIVVGPDSKSPFLRVFERP